MKRTYETPVVEKIAFQYQEQVVAASGGSSACDNVWISTDGDNCNNELIDKTSMAEL